MTDRDNQPASLDPPSSSDGERWWFEQPRNVERMIYVLYAICAVLFVIDPFIHKHGNIEILHYWGFYGISSFIACVVLVVVAKVARNILMRPEDYYDR